MNQAEPRTLLAQLIKRRNQSARDAVDEFHAQARELGVNATLSQRHLRRLMAGEMSSAHPGTRRVAEAVWGRSFAELVGPPLAPAAVLVTTATARPPLDHSPVGGAAGLGDPAAGPLSLNEELLMAAEDSARFVRRAGAVLTTEVLEQLEADVVSLAEQYLRRPPYAMFKPLSRLRGEVFEMLESHPRPEHARELYRCAGMISSLLAHLSSDLGQPYGVDTHTRAAWLCADLSGDDHQRAYIRWVQSQVAYWQGNYSKAATACCA